jgi:hypothetical protein
MPYKFLGTVPEQAQVPAEQGRFKYIGKAEPEEDYEGLLPPRDIGRTAKVVGAHVIGIPGNIKRFLKGITESAVSYATGREIPTKYKEADVDILPTTEELTKKTEELFPSLAPRTPGEEKYEDVLGTFTDIAMPIPGKKLELGANLIRPLLGTAAGEAAGYGAELQNLPEGAKQAAKVVAQIIPMVVGGKLTPTTEEAKDLYKAGKLLGLSEEELTPLLKSEGKLRFLSKMAKESPEIAERMKSVEEKLGFAFQDVRETGKNLPPLSPEQEKNFINKIGKIHSDLSETINPSEEKQKAINFLKDTMENIKTGKMKITPATLENYYRDINASVDWRKVGTKSLSGVKEAIKDTFKDISPELSFKFEKSNELYKRMKNFSEKVHWDKDLEKNVFWGEAGGLITGLFTGHFTKVVEGIATATALRKISTNLLTNPNWQSITRTTSKAALEKSPKLVNLAYNQLKEKVKEEFPKDYNEINWPE